ncbi:MAG: adenylate/guanylate cyclase domain-containing protein, partial [Planctomycetota bacterium]
MNNAAPSDFLIRVFKHEQLVHTQWLKSALVIGRQDSKQGEPAPYELCDVNHEEVAVEPGCRKLVIAGSREVSLSRNQAVVELFDEGRVRISNVSEHVAMYVDQRRLPPLIESAHQPMSHEADLNFGAVNVIVDNGECSFRVEKTGHADDAGPLMSLSLATLAPGEVPVDEVAPLVDLIKRGTDLTATDLAEWLLNTMSRFQKGANATEFLTHATDSLGGMVGLDYVAGLSFRDGDWQIVHENSNAEDRAPSSRILQQVLDEKRSFRAMPDDSSSLAGVKSLVAAPILTAAGEVAGALYGDRRSGSPEGVLTELEQMVVELVASGVANGIARLEQQKAAVRAQVQFEQFFGPVLANELNNNPELLDGRETEVTVLFCDITGFSRISDRVGPQQTLAWINDALNELSQCVVDREGVVVDYIGDELMAMWGAPQAVENHAQLACLAALEMQKRLTQINDRWEPTVGERTEIRIGINSGQALVGNTGSQLKFKYGPMGTTVNVASRMCSATKFIKRNVLITGGTAARCGLLEQARRLCSVEVVNIPDPVSVYELVELGDEAWCPLKRGYESALDHFENANFRQAAQELSDVLMSHPHDDPAIMLLARAVNA